MEWVFRKYEKYFDPVPIDFESSGASKGMQVSNYVSRLRIRDRGRGGGGGGGGGGGEELRDYLKKSHLEGDWNDFSATRYLEKTEWIHGIMCLFGELPNIENLIHPGFPRVTVELQICYLAFKHLCID